MPKGEAARAEWALTIGRDGFDLLEQVFSPQAPIWLREVPAIEGTIGQAVALGARRSRYLGLAKTHLAHILTATAINLIRLDAWWTDTPLGHTRTSHLAALDIALAG
jgi:hypothetical protein